MKKLILILTVFTFYFTGCDINQNTGVHHNDKELTGQYSAYYGFRYAGTSASGQVDKLLDTDSYNFKKPVKAVRELVSAKDTQSTTNWSDKEIDDFTDLLIAAEIDAKLLIFSKGGPVLIVKEEPVTSGDSGGGDDGDGDDDDDDDDDDNLG